MSEKYFYKIKDNKTGLYHTGGIWNCLSKTGKVWRNKRALGGHLALYGGYDRKVEDELKDADWTVEFYSTEPVKTMNIQEYLRERSK